MLPSVKKIGTIILYCIAITVLLLLLMSNMAAWLSPDRYWPIAVTGLLFPFLFLMCMVGTLVTLLLRKRLALLFLLSILISIPNVLKTVAIGSTKKNTTSNSIRVMSWNVGIMNFSASDTMTAIRENKKIFTEIKNSQAEVVCLQEFFTALYPGSHYNLLDSVARTMRYPYFYFSKDHPYFSAEFYSGSVIFSKYPIIDTLRIPFRDGSNGAVIKATILKGKDTINVVTSRLQPIYLNGYDYATIGMQKKEHAIWRGVPTIVRKLQFGFKQRTSQVAQIDSLVKKSKYPVITCLDLNDTPTGNAYHCLHKNMADVWRSAGAGLGRTFQFFSPTLRIDYIFCSDTFEPVYVQRINSSGSDHLALITQLQIKKGAK